MICKQAQQDIDRNLCAQVNTHRPDIPREPLPLLQRKIPQQKKPEDHRYGGTLCLNEQGEQKSHIKIQAADDLGKKPLTDQKHDHEEGEHQAHIGGIDITAAQRRQEIEFCLHPVLYMHKVDAAGTQDAKQIDTGAPGYPAPQYRTVKHTEAAHAVTDQNTADETEAADTPGCGHLPEYPPAVRGKQCG